MVCNKTDTPSELNVDGFEILTADEKPLREIIKRSGGKYTLIVNGGFRLANAADFANEAQSYNSDVLLFDGGYCFKTSILKNVNNKYADKYSAEIAATLSSKSISKSSCKPLEYIESETEYTDEFEQSLLESLSEFEAVKTRIQKEVYNFARDLICEKLIKFYMCAMLAIRKKQLDAQKLIDFDENLGRNHVILYHILENRFDAADFEKLKSKKFKISFITANKFKKILKK